MAAANTRVVPNVIRHSYQHQRPENGLGDCLGHFPPPIISPESELLYAEILFTKVVFILQDTR